MALRRLTEKESTLKSLTAGLLSPPLLSVTHVVQHRPEPRRGAGCWGSLPHAQGQYGFFCPPGCFSFSSFSLKAWNRRQRLWSHQKQPSSRSNQETSHRFSCDGLVSWLVFIYQLVVVQHVQPQNASYTPSYPETSLYQHPATSKVALHQSRYQQKKQETRPMPACSSASISACIRSSISPMRASTLNPEVPTEGCGWV